MRCLLFIILSFFISSSAYCWYVRIYDQVEQRTYEFEITVKLLPYMPYIYCLWSTKSIPQEVDEIEQLYAQINGGLQELLLNYNYIFFEDDCAYKAQLYTPSLQYDDLTLSLHSGCPHKLHASCLERQDSTGEDNEESEDLKMSNANCDTGSCK